MTGEQPRQHEMTEHDRFMALCRDLMGELDDIADTAEDIRYTTGRDTIPADHPDLPELWKRATDAFQRARHELHLKHGAIEESMFAGLDDHLRELQQELEETCGRMFEETQEPED